MAESNLTKLQEKERKEARNSVIYMALFVAAGISVFGFYLHNTRTNSNLENNIYTTIQHNPADNSTNYNSRANTGDKK